MPTVTELFDGRDGSISSGGRGNEGIQRRYKRRFRVFMDNWQQGILDIFEATGIPRIGDPFVSGTRLDLTARCHSLTPESTAEPRLWIVNADYSSDKADFGNPLKEVPGGPANQPGQKDGAKNDPNKPSDETDDPLKKPAEISWSDGTYTVMVYKDNAGRACAYSNGQPFDPPITLEKTYLILTIKRNQPTFDAKKMVGFAGATNKESFFGFDPGTVKARPPTATQQFTKNGRAYFETTYVFEIRDESPFMEVLDAGYWDLSGVGGKPKSITMPNGRPVPAPWPLSGGIAMTAAAVAAGGANYIILYFGTEKSFAGLNLP